jgi:hypothetical protein
MSKGALSWFYNASTYNQKVIEYWIFLIKNWIKYKWKFIVEFGCALGIARKPLVIKI